MQLDGTMPAAALAEGEADVDPESVLAAATKRFLHDRLAMIGLIFVLALICIAAAAPLIAPHDPLQQYDSGLNDYGAPLAPGPHFLLGTDILGRDLESRLIYGARISLLIGTLANGLAVTIGVTLGAVSGYFGRAVETLIMRFTDVMMSFPLILLLIALAVILQPNVAIIILVIAIGSWAGTARLIHGEVLSIKERDYIMAARSIGASDTAILWRHVLPQLLPSIIVWAMLGIAPAVMTESVLSFLGVGVQPPTPSWGNMISSGQTAYLTAPWLVLCPGFAVMLTVISFNLVGDGLRDALFPGGGRR
jgi:peptide/nickel transport system permease protein